MTDNALDPPPARRTGRVPRRRAAAIAVGIVVVVVFVLVVGRFVLHHPAADSRARHGFGGAGVAQVQTPPAVSPAAAAQTRADLRAAQRTAESPVLGRRRVQVATVSPPAGAPPSGVGVDPSRASIGPAAG